MTPRHRTLPRRAVWLLYALAPALCAFAAAPGTPAAAAAGREGAGVTLPVQQHSSPLRTVSTATYRLDAGEKLALDTPAMTFSVDSWGSGRPTNIGTTLLLTCTGPDGRPALRAHDGANLTPDERHRDPDIRALLVARDSGTHRCELSASAYSTARAPGMTVRLAGEEPLDGERGLVSTRASRDAATWTRPAAQGDLLLSPGTVAEPMTTRKSVRATGPLPRTRVDLALDAEVTACNRADAYGLCAQRPAHASGATLASWVEVQGLDEAGEPVGAPRRSPTRTRTVSAAKHHTMLHHTVRVSVPGEVEQLDIALKTQVVSGDHMVFHAGYGYARGVLTKPPSGLPEI
ncbi:hypothetical protein MMF93_14680 [Streptomyces tubbatahanensis]|uniref:Uncharacterized protein n=1 Tax=Streptomyces tubbatahanensis TaxID=2923272 RepID=A0ABY3XTA0_9ACTN|nr:hypothetical protein [Streptomyces tubbatahanensis]UNS97595.1 hypothetical protein MMF93_14680 [Streptomyces tubbatahanensis]